MRRNVVFLTVTVLVIVGTFVATIMSGNKPILGLDLQGGVSVVLSPVGNYKADSLDVAVDVIRERVDALGVAEPEISRQGNDIVVDLPGVKDRAKAERLVGQTAELRFRPVLADVPPAGESTKPSSTTTTSGTGSTTTAPTTTTTVPAGDEAAKAAVAACSVTDVSSMPSVPTTARADDTRDACVVLPVRSDGDNPRRVFLGPTKFTGRKVDSAKSEFASTEGWRVNLDLSGDGLSAFNALAAEEFPKGGRVAIVLDGVVQSDPRFNAASYPNGVTISGSFTQGEASDLAKLINYGALPVQLKKVNVANVSPSLGDDQLHAGIVAGVIGLALVAVYMLVFYRLLGLVVISGLILVGMAIYTLVAYLGDAIGLTLTLAGVTGIIVSVGVTVDSYVVYFERLKDEVRGGATVRSSVDRAFHRSFRTILAADIVSLIGAGVLYWLAIGGVRGFAFYLGLSTLLDLFISYFYMHPVVSLLARRSELVRLPGVGIAAGLDVPGAVA